MAAYSIAYTCLGSEVVKQGQNVLNCYTDSGEIRRDNQLWTTMKNQSIHQSMVYFT